MAREKLLEGKDSRLVKVIVEIEVPIAYYNPITVARKLEDFILSSQMLGYDHPNCYKIREEPADACQVQECE